MNRPILNYRHIQEPCKIRTNVSLLILTCSLFLVFMAPKGKFEDSTGAIITVASCFNTLKKTINQKEKYNLDPEFRKRQQNAAKMVFLNEMRFSWEIFVIMLFSLTQSNSKRRKKNKEKTSPPPTSGVQQAQ
jgi:hypothetical protein